MKKQRYINFAVIGAFIIIIGGLGAIYYAALTNRHNDVMNNAYIRVTNCILSTPPNQRGKAQIDQCYDRVEADLGVQLQRYNNTQE